MTIKIDKPGLLSLVQDYGRFGYKNVGVTNGGPMDEHAFLWANRLLGNDFQAPQLEITFGNFTATFMQPTMIALTGADCGIKLNNQEISPWKSYFVRAGDQLSMSTPKKGLRTYLSVKDGFTVKPQLGSVATVTREKLGGLKAGGDKLAMGSAISYSRCKEEYNKVVPRRYIPDYKSSVLLRFTPNLSATGVTEQAIEQLESQSFKVSAQIDRMGYRLEGSKVDVASRGIVSQGIALGAIQIPKDGHPIVLMRDRQTMGGYPLAGCIAYLDIAKLAQSTPGTQIMFKSTSIEALERELIVYKQFFNVSH